MEAWCWSARAAWAEARYSNIFARSAPSIPRRPRRRSFCDVSYHRDAMPNWESMWAGGLKPGQAFDAAKCEPAFTKLLSTATGLPTGRALVPGCGRGYAVAALARAGYDATGLDIAPTAAAAANEYLASGAEEGIEGLPCRVEAADFFDYTGSFDLIYDCTFLCAIQPEERSSWAQKMDELLTPETGELVTLIFPVASPPYTGGPPYCMSPELVTSLLEPLGFEALSMSEVPSNELARGGKVGSSKEFIARWRRKA